jgi:haloalkane dehalogenase
MSPRIRRAAPGALLTLTMLLTSCSSTKTNDSATADTTVASETRAIQPAATETTPEASPTSADSQPVASVAAAEPGVPQAFRDCMAKNGIELPEGPLKMPEGADQAVSLKAFTACQSELPAGMSPPGIGATSGASPSSTVAGEKTTASVALAAGCDVEPEIRTTPAGVKYLRTPDACFEGLPDWPYQPKYFEIDGLRQAYVDEGAADGEVVLLLHGQPSWSYLYRFMIPGLVKAGYRVIAMDHLGMGRSDKPTDFKAYSTEGHVKRLERFIDGVGIRGANVFMQDQGGVIGLKAVSEQPDLFGRIVVGNGGGVPDIPKDVEIPTALDAKSADAFAQQIAKIPAQQPPFFGADGKSLLPVASDANSGGYGSWLGFALWSDKFSVPGFIEALTYRPLSGGEKRAYNAPFPRRDYMTGPRVFPSLLTALVGKTDAEKAALEKLKTPVLTIFGQNDPGLAGGGDGRPFLQSLPGAAGQDHHVYPDASHFLQDDKGADIAVRVDAFIKANPIS